MTDERNATLADVLDSVIDQGAVVQGDLVVRIADLDLLFVGLRVIITSISRQEKIYGARIGAVNQTEMRDGEFLKKLQAQIDQSQKHINEMLKVESPRVEVESGLSQLVLTLLKLIVDLVEREVERRIELGSLTEKEIEKLGLSLKALETKIEELRLIFGVKKEDLNLDLGPLGKLREEI